MKKIKSSQTLLIEKPSYLKLKKYPPKINNKQLNSNKEKEQSVSIQKLYHSRTYLYKQIQSRYKELKDQYTIILQENKQNNFQFENGKKQIERLKIDHQKNLKQIQRLNLMINLIKKNDQGCQVNVNQWSKGSWLSRQKSTEGQIMRQTIKDLWIPQQQDYNYSRTLYHEKQKLFNQQLAVHTTLQRISKKKQIFDWNKIKKSNKINQTSRINMNLPNERQSLLSIKSPKKYTLNFNQIKRLSNSPYSRINFTKK